MCDQINAKALAHLTMHPHFTAAFSSAIIIIIVLISVEIGVGVLERKLANNDLVTFQVSACLGRNL